jgi:polyisoprenoid-binding protein YceI
MNYFLIFILSSLSVTGFRTVDDSDTISSQKIDIKFIIRNAGMDVTGTIQTTAADIRLYPDKLTESIIRVVADPSTVDTGISIRDKHLKRSDYFDAAKYPAITLQSKKINASGKKKFKAQCNLTIKNTTRNIEMFFSSDRMNNDGAIYKGSFEINRLDFYLGEKSAILDEKIKILFEVSMTDL